MTSPQNIHKLSGSNATGDPIELATYPTKTTIHTVPAGESHELDLWAINGEDTDRDVLGNWGDSTDKIRIICVGKTLTQIAKGVLVGPTSVTLGRITGAQTRIIGTVSVHKYTS